MPYLVVVSIRRSVTQIQLNVVERGRHVVTHTRLSWSVKAGTHPTLALTHLAPIKGVDSKGRPPLEVIRVCDTDATAKSLLPPAYGNLWGSRNRRRRLLPLNPEVLVLAQRSFVSRFIISPMHILMVETMSNRSVTCTCSHLGGVTVHPRRRLHFKFLRTTRSLVRNIFLSSICLLM